MAAGQGIESHVPARLEAALFAGYLGAALMLGRVEAWIGVLAERRALESVAAPLSNRDAH